MILSYSLGRDVSCEKLCKDVAKVVNKLSRLGTDMSTYQLVIDIKPITDSSDSLLPKLEFKNTTVDKVIVTPTIL